MGKVNVTTDSGTRRSPAESRRSRAIMSINALPFLLTLPLILYAVASYHATVDKLEEQEKTERVKEIQMCASALNERCAYIDGIVGDYSELSGTRQALQIREAKWQSRNLADWLPSHMDVQIVLLTDRRGNTVASTGPATPLRRDLLRGPHLTEAIHGVSSYGLVRLGNLIYMVATEPVRPTSSKTKIVGTLTFAKQVDSDILTSMAKMTPCGLALYVDGVCNAVDSRTSTRNELPAAPEEGYVESLPRAETIVRASSDGSRVFAWQALNDWNGRDIGVLMTSSSATQTLASRRDIFVRSLILTASCLLASLLAALQMRAARLAQRAHIDELTGLPNHRYLQERLAQEVVRARRYGRDFAVAMLDIDHFKHINDEYGHQVGDQALRQLADVLRTTLRDTDVVARYGGEEFLVIMPETDLPSAMAFGERARKAVDETTFDVRLNGSAGRRASRMKFHFTVSVGVAKYPDHAERADELIMAADLALFAAKHASRNAVRSYEAIENEHARKVRNPLTIHLAMREGSLAAVRALAAAVDARDHTMRGHSEKVALYSLAIGQSLDLHEDEMNTLRTAALLHDVGRIAVPDRILWKRGELSEEERAVVMTHSATGSEILSKAPQLAQVAEVVRSHHERYDGAGYPDSLSGENIPLLSRIICVADSFDAMTSDRSYKQAVTAREAVMQMRKQSGLQFDPQMVDTMDRLVSSGELFRMLGSSWDEPARAA